MVTYTRPPTVVILWSKLNGAGPLAILMRRTPGTIRLRTTPAWRATPFGWARHPDAWIDKLEGPGHHPSRRTWLEWFAVHLDGPVHRFDPDDLLLYRISTALSGLAPS